MNSYSSANTNADTNTQQTQLHKLTVTQTYSQLTYVKLNQTDEYKSNLLPKNLLELSIYMKSFSVIKVQSAAWYRYEYLRIYWYIPLELLNITFLIRQVFWLAYKK